jgi:ADP-ribose pyrophosphatase
VSEYGNIVRNNTFFMSLEIKEIKQVFKGRFLSIFDTHFLDKNGGERHWEWIQKKEIVMVLPITKEGKLVLIKNFRVPIQKYVIEIPAGMIDQYNESAEESVRRELLEETGYVVEKLVSFPVSPYAPGTSNNLFTPFIGLGAIRVNDQAGDVTEDIVVMEVSPREMMDLYLHPQADVLFNIRIFALYYLGLQQGIIPN